MPSRVWKSVIPRSGAAFGRGLPPPSGRPRVTKGVRQNHKHSRGIHPEGFGRRSTGKPGGAMQVERRLAKTQCRVSRKRGDFSKERSGVSWRHPRTRAISGGPSREMRGESRKRNASHASRALQGHSRGRAEHCEARSKGMRGRAACPRTALNARNLESRVKSLPAKELLPPEHESMASGPLEACLGI